LPAQPCQVPEAGCPDRRALMSRRPGHPVEAHAAIVGPRQPDSQRSSRVPRHPHTWLAAARVGPDVVLIATLNRTRDLVPDDLAVVRLDGSVAEGDPGGMSTEVVAMHVEVYRARPRAGAVIHTHSPHLLAFALAGRPLPARYEPLPRLGQAEEVPVAPAAPVAACIELIKATGHAGRSAGRPRGARLRPGYRDDGLAPGRARGGGGGRTAHRCPRPVIRASRDIAHLGDGRRGALCHGGRIPGHQGR
jgi:Class II Aldolase and Adducin N-terminal domain